MGKDQLCSPDTRIKTNRLKLAKVFKADLL